MSGAEERVFPASRSRRQSLRRRGDVVAASWLQVGLPVAVCLWMMECFGGGWFEQFRLVLGEELRSGIELSWNGQQAWDKGMRVAVRLASVTWPLVFVPWVTCVGLRLLQTRFLFTWETLRPDQERLSFSAGFRRMGAAVAGGNMGRTILQCLVAGGICAAVGWAMSGDGPARWSWATGEGVVQGLLDLGLRPFRILGFSLVFVGLADLIWQGVAYERRIRMTAQEVREELRNSERKANGRVAGGQMLAEVPPAATR
jgi:flagellar biosynthesis protein FlhB